MLSFRSDFIKNSATLIGATGTAQLVVFLSALVLSRIYSADQFGVLAVYTSLTSFFSIVATGRYELAINLPEKDSDAKSIFTLAFLITLFCGLLSLGIVHMFKQQIIQWYDAPEIASWLYLIPVSVIAFALYQILMYWNLRFKKIKWIGITKVADSLTNASSKVLLGYYSISGNGLIIGNLVGRVGAILLLAKNLKSIPFKINRNVIDQGRKYIDLLRINTFHAFADVLHGVLVIMFLTDYYGLAVVGFYTFAIRYLKTPLGLVGSSISQVFLQKISSLYAEGKPIHSQVGKVISTLFAIGLPIFVILFIWGDDLFVFFFSEKWRKAGEYAVLLCPWLFFSFLVSPISNLPIIVNKQKPFFLISIIGHILTLSCIYWGKTNHINIEEVLLWYSILATMHSIIILIWFYKISRKP